MDQQRDNRQLAKDNGKPSRSRGGSPRSRVVQWLLDAIASGKLKPGDAVPTVDELSSMLGVARNTAAAAIVAAEKRRVVERRSPGARKRYVPICATEAPVMSSAVCVLGTLGRYWFYPCVLEQYVYYVPVDASNAKLIRTYLALYRAEGNPLDLAKARALGDALVRIQRPNGYIPTEYAQVEKRDDSMKGWLNCTCFTLAALAELAEF